MGGRYFEIVLTGRQLAGLIGGLAVAVLIAFGIGIAVGMQRPGPPLSPPANWASAAQVPTIPPVRTPPPLPVPTESVTPAPELEPTPAPTDPPDVPTPEPRPTATPVPPTRTPAPTPTANAAGGRWVQVGALSRVDLAEGVRQRVIALGFRPEQVSVEPSAGKFRVRLGPFPDVESARRVAARLQAEGFPGAFIVRE